MFSYAPLHLIPFPNPWFQVTTDLLFVTIVLPILEFHMTEWSWFTAGLEKLCLSIWMSGFSLLALKKEFIGPGLPLWPVRADHARLPLQWTLNSCLAPVGMTMEG